MLVLALALHAAGTSIIYSIIYFKPFIYDVESSQVVSAKRHSDLSKNVDIPVECNLEKLTAWDTMRLYINKNVLRNPDPCEEYYRVLMTDPSYEVNPFVALIDMLVIGVFQPLEYIGTKIGSFFDGLLSK